MNIKKAQKSKKWVITTKFTQLTRIDEVRD